MDAEPAIESIEGQTRVSDEDSYEEGDNQEYDDEPREAMRSPGGRMVQRTVVSEYLPNKTNDDHIKSVLLWVLR